MKPRALDLFCGAGGASMGLHRAGFEVIGCDLKKQPRYPFQFVQADALAPPFDLRDFDFIWASPPCQAYCAGTPAARRALYPRLISPVRALLASSGALTAIENSPLAPLRKDLILDGTMFPELRVIRARAFELNWWFGLAPSSRRRPNMIAQGYSCVVGGGRCSGAPVASNAWHTVAAKKRAMGIDWMAGHELAQAIPPAYAELIGRAALSLFKRAA